METDTNFEKIKAMNKDEMVEFLQNIQENIEDFGDIMWRGGIRLWLDRDTL